MRKFLLLLAVTAVLGAGAFLYWRALPPRFSEEEKEIIASLSLPSLPPLPPDPSNKHADEPLAANALLVGETVIYPAAFPRTRARLEERGIHVKTVDVDEIAKAEGGVTCCSLVFGE